MSSKISENVSEDLMKILNPSHSNSKNLQSDIAVAVAAKQQVHNLTKVFNSKKIKETEDVVKDKDTEETNSAKVSNDLDKEQSIIATGIVPNVGSNDKDKEQPNSPTKIISNIENNDNKEYDDECEDTIDPEKSSPQEGGVNKKTKKRMRSGSRSTRGRKTFTQKVYSE